MKVMCDWWLQGSAIRVDQPTCWLEAYQAFRHLDPPTSDTAFLPIISPLWSYFSSRKFVWNFRKISQSQQWVNEYPINKFFQNGESPHFYRIWRITFQNWNNIKHQLSEFLLEINWKRRGRVRTRTLGLVQSLKDMRPVRHFYSLAVLCKQRYAEAAKNW